jgi:hypothetical protein
MGSFYSPAASQGVAAPRGGWSIARALAREGWGVRLLDLILTLLVLWGLLVVARHQAPAYDDKTYAPAAAQTASPAPGATPAP